MIDKEIILIDKPAGISSFDVIRIIRKRIGERKIGHAGTLDPLASGLMLLGVAAGTKRLTALIGLDKEYEARILFGIRTSTGDLEGEVEERSVPVRISDDLLRDALYSMGGILSLAVPRYSAIKVSGKRLYQYARKNQPVEIPCKEMCVRDASLVCLRKSVDGTMEAEVVFRVSSGTYIRSLAEELGRRIGVPATLAGLRRTKIGVYHVRNALPISRREIDQLRNRC